jgi:hypothetical protein
MHSISETELREFLKNEDNYIVDEIGLKIFTIENRNDLYFSQKQLSALKRAKSIICFTLFPKIDFMHLYIHVIDDKNVQRDVLVPYRLIEDSFDTSKPMEQKQFKTYFFANEELTRVKIGRALDVEKRFKTIQAGSHEKLILLKVIDANIEKELHEKFEDYRLNGEWFHFHKDIKEYLT